MAARGSMAFGMMRLFTRSSFTIWWAFANAASVAARSPTCQSKQVFPFAWSQTSGASGAMAFATVATAGSSS